MFVYPAMAPSGSSLRILIAVLDYISSTIALLVAGLTATRNKVQQWRISLNRRLKSARYERKNADKDKNKDKRLICCIASGEIQQSANPVHSQEAYELLCSYNWKQTHEDEPTIYVPGTPARYTPPLIHRKPSIDTEPAWQDQHAHRVPEHQFEPVFQALTVMNPDMKFNNVDIMINRSSLQNLFEFVKGRGALFDLDLDVIGKTLVVGRKVKASTYPNGKGWGRNFEKTYTTKDPELEEADGHHRVLKYNFGGLCMVIRIEVDAYDPDAQNEVDASANPILESVLSAAPINSIPHQSPRYTAVIPKGTLISHSKMMEFKSNTHVEAIEQMWFGRTPNFCGAKDMPVKNEFDQPVKDKDGKPKTEFEVVLKHTDQARFEKFERQYQDKMRLLVSFLVELRRVVMEETAEGSAELRLVEKGRVNVYETKKETGALPQDIVDRFWVL
jgi:hypothetical protein